MTHICTHEEPEKTPVTAEIVQQGYLYSLVLKNAPQTCVGRHGGGKRGRVTEFTRAARWRLLKTLAPVNWGRARHITLTYPAGVSRDVLVRNQYHLRAFVERWRRHYDYRPCFVWRKEYTKKGVIHFHLLQPKPKWHDDLIVFVSRSWAEVLATDRTEDIIKAGTKVEFARNNAQSMSYVAKYIAKASDKFPEYHSGRVWGWVGRDGFTYKKAFTYIVPVSEFFYQKEKLEKRIGHHIFAKRLDRLIKWW